MQPYSQPLLWWVQLAAINTMTYWFNGLPYPGIKNASAPTGGVKYWFNGGMIRTVYR